MANIQARLPYTNEYYNEVIKYDSNFTIDISDCGYLTNSELI